MFIGPVDRYHSEIGGRAGQRRLFARYSRCADESDFAGALRVQLLCLTREVERLLNVERSCARLRLIDGLLDREPIALENRDGSGENVGAQHHDTVARREGLEI